MQERHIRCGPRSWVAVPCLSWSEMPQTVLAAAQSSVARATQSCRQVFAMLIRRYVQIVSNTTPRAWFPSEWLERGDISFRSDTW